jgi:hypothetical protein
MTKAEKRAQVRAEIQDWTRMAFPDAKDIPQDPEEGEAMQRAADRRAAKILEKIVMEGLI